jgi:hypothetical protein
MDRKSETGHKRNERRRNIMKRTLVSLLLVAAFILPGLAGAVSEEDFKAKTTRNLMNLCTAPADDPLRDEAIHFCYGYLVGAYHYYEAENSGPDGDRLVCIPSPAPSRDEAIGMFIKWTYANSQYMDEKPVETEFRFLSEIWPCK